jgi:hypothetical protein
MNQKKESILNDNINNFLCALGTLNFAYSNRNELNIYKYPCIVERYATRLITHYEDWTTINNDLQYKEKINNRLQCSHALESLNDNLIQFIKEQQNIDGMMYYTYELLKCANIIN